MPECKDEQLDLPLYKPVPQAWVPKAHISADLGYSGFHPPRPGRDEDVLSIASIKNGFVFNKAVSAETFSAQTTLSDTLRSDETIATLEQLMNELFARRTTQIPPIPTSTFRIPSRVTLNDAKRQAWFADLANPDVPLYKLGKNVPHGAKGHDLLDLLQSNNVAIPRAVWFLRVFGANETAGLRTKPSYNPTQYSIEWTNVMTGYLKKQLAEIKLPSAPRPGLNIKQTFKGVLADLETRERWVSRFAYCLQLLRSFYPEGLVDHRTFLSWLVEQMSTCNLAQAAFVARIADEYLDGMVGSRPLIRPFVEACLAKLSEIYGSPEPELLVDTESLLKSLLQRICLAHLDAFVSPRMWFTHQGLVASVMTDQSTLDRCQDVHLQQSGHEIHRALLNHLGHLRVRNDAMLFRSLPSSMSAKLGRAISDIELLNSISHTTNLSTLIYLPEGHHNSSAFAEKIDLLLTWSITPLQFGEHRPFAAATIIRFWRDRTANRATQRECAPHDELLQDHLFEWLDKSDIAGQPPSLKSVALLYGKLVKFDLFSYASYLQRLIARGDLGLSCTDPEHARSRHYDFIRWIPLHHSTSSLINQRRVVLYGTRLRETPEDSNEKEIRKEIRVALPELFAGDPRPEMGPKGALANDCRHFLSASRYEQVRTVRSWLLPLLRQFITSGCSDITEWSTILKIYCLSSELMAETQCFSSLLEVTLWMLQHSATPELLTAVVDVLNRFATIWACMDAMAEIAQNLFTAHQIWKNRGIQSRLLLNLLIDFNCDRYLAEHCRQQVSADISSFTLALQPVTGQANPVPSVLPEVLLLATDPAAEAPSLLANALWINYRRSHDWAWKVWDNAIASLRQVPSMASTPAESAILARRYGTFLRHVDQHVPSGLDSTVLDWFLGHGRNEISAISVDAWDIVVTVLVFLSVHGALKTTTILTGLVYPCWQAGASLSHPSGAASYEILLSAVNDICSRLLLEDDEKDQVDILEDQCIRTRRQDVYREPHFSSLIGNIPILVALENNQYISEMHRLRCQTIRRELCEKEEFRCGVFRNLTVVRDAFEHAVPASEEAFGNLTRATIAALKLVLCEPADEFDLTSWTDSASLLSPWKIAATTVHLQFVLRQIGRGRESEDLGAGLDQLTTTLLEHTLSSEEAYFVAQMTKGAGSAISDKFINNGLQCVTDILSRTTLTGDILSSIQRAEEVLRALVCIMVSLREDSHQLPSVDPAIQNNLFCTLSAKFAEINSSSVLEQDDSMLLIVLLARLVQFDLGLQGIWTTKSIEESGRLAKALFDLILHYSTGDCANLTAYSLLLDTFYFLIDEIPPDPKATFDPFRHYPAVEAADLPGDIPTEYRKQLEALIPHSSSTSVVQDLVSCHRDSDGNLVCDGPVANRPWEWIENLGEPPAVNGDETDLSAKPVVKNTGSLSLENFAAQMTGERIMESKEGDVRVEDNIRSYEDVSDGIFVRDWRQTRVNLEAPIARNKQDGDVEVSWRQGRRTPRTSPSSTSATSRSTQGSLRQSPSHNEGIDVESTASATSSTRKNSSSKRKASSDEDGGSKAKKQKNVKVKKR